MPKSKMTFRVKDLPPDMQRQALEQGARDGGLFAGEAKARKNKYNAHATMLDGRRFDSKSEAHRYQELQMLVQAGHIRDLVLQQEYVLVPDFVDNEGKKRGKVSYVADFTYFDLRTGKTVIEDAKSIATARNATFRVKWRMMQYLFRERDDVTLLVNMS